MLYTTIQTFSLPYNGRQLLLPFGNKRVCKARVKHIAWQVNPLLSPNNSMLWLSCPEIYKNNASQSAMVLANPADSTGQEPLVLRRDLIASWCIAPASTGIPNPNYNDPQPEIPLTRDTYLNQLTFLLEADNETNLFVNVQPIHKVSITMEFFVWE